MTKRMIVATTLLIAFACGGLAAARAIDEPKIDGKWSGQVPRPNQDYDAIFNFKVSGEKLTGTVYVLEQDMDINEGKVKGDTISFKIGSTPGTYTGKITGDEIAMKVNLSGGESGNRVMNFTLKRMKE